MTDERKDSPSPLPPLRIHHLFAWITVASVVASLWFALLSPATRQMVDVWTAVLVSTDWTLLATSLTIVLFGQAWYRQNLPFPSQPGHWIAIYVCWKYTCELLVYYLMRKAFLNPSAIQVVVLNVPYYVVVLGLCAAAYCQEPSKPWRRGWAALALYAMLEFAFAVYCLILLLHRYLYSLLWVEGPVSRQIPAILEGEGRIWYRLIAGYVLLALVSIAVAADLRNSRYRHWSHWAVVAVLLINLVLNAILYQWIIFLH